MVSDVTRPTLMLSDVNSEFTGSKPEQLDALRQINVGMCHVFSGKVVAKVYVLPGSRCHVLLCVARQRRDRL